ncbi:hypothetical protein V8J82_01375 [Gymnodinialimonas sp. 2305UL16-5]|uniref:hypothetical protein n=1 Tax=Gymnodinialimonas mytili TaxID=3126503 RepID=UPI00309E94B5
MQAADLSRLRARLPACELAAYVDIGAGTVLASDGALTYPQEYLDVLRDCAALVFSVPNDDGIFDHAMVQTPTGSRVFIRDPNAPDLVICCICAPWLVLSDLLSETRQILAELDAAALQGSQTVEAARG